MADLLREGDTIVLRLSPLEKVEGVHGDINVPVSAVESVEIVDDIIHAVHGIKMPGTRVPGLFAMGTFVSRGGAAFAIVHHQNKRGVRIHLNGTTYNELIVGLDDPESVVNSLGLSRS